ncbi:MAG TPA: integrase arm-type DNA-binding domain-containing protein [Steroidobacteraceae bacterium]|nr:integrase arm-type DNA-binding domain-containing protein [Steroidobacteraceae bacterium]
MALTDKEIQALQPQPKKYKIFDGDGLYLLVHPKGGKYWYMKYHIGARPHEVAFGTYPKVTLKHAREKREEARQQIARGLNPKIERQATREARSVLFSGVAEEWAQMISTRARHPSNAGAREAILDPATVKKHRWILDNYLIPKFGKWPISEITAQQFLPLLKGIEEQGKSETAHRVRSLASRIFSYAEATGRAPQGDVTRSLRDALTPLVVSHHPTITDPAKVGELLLAIDSYTGQPETCCALKLAPLVMLRPRELRYGEWSEVSFEKAEWRIPAERMKMDSPHIVPLSRQAVVILYDLKKAASERAKHIFPVSGSKDGVMSENTMSKALRLLGYPGDVMTAHGFRSMASTLLNEQQTWHPDAIERQLAHSPRDKIRAAYNYAEHLPERRRMMQAWADYLEDLKETARAQTKGNKVAA